MKNEILQYKIDKEDEKMYKNIFKIYTSTNSKVWLGSYLITLMIYGLVALLLTVINMNLLSDIWYGTSPHIKLIAVLGLFVIIQGVRAKNIILNNIKAKYAPNVVNNLIDTNVKIKRIEIKNGYLNYIIFYGTGRKRHI